MVKCGRVPTYFWDNNINKDQNNNRNTEEMRT